MEPPTITLCCIQKRYSLLRWKGKKTVARVTAGADKWMETKETYNCKIIPALT